MDNYINLNGNPEDKIPLAEGQEYLARSGQTVGLKIDKTDAVLKTDTVLTTETFAPTFFSFFLKKEEIMKITPEGFFWKGKLVENDKEIYQKFKEFLNTPR
jgi:hypothetical protein